MRQALSAGFPNRTIDISGDVIARTISDAAYAGLTQCAKNYTPYGKDVQSLPPYGHNFFAVRRRWPQCGYVFCSGPSPEFLSVTDAQLLPPGLHTAAKWCFGRNFAGKEREALNVPPAFVSFMGRTDWALGKAKKLCYGRTEALSPERGDSIPSRTI